HAAHLHEHQGKNRVRNQEDARDDGEGEPPRLAQQRVIKVAQRRRVTAHDLEAVGGARHRDALGLDLPPRRHSRSQPARTESTWPPSTRNESMVQSSRTVSPSLIEAAAEICSGSK